MYGKAPTEKDKPSLKFSFGATAEDKENKSVLVAQKVCKTLKCCICHRKRCVYSNCKLTCCMNEDLTKVIENEENACDGSLVPDDNPQRR